jgi:hypothetical protein
MFLKIVIAIYIAIGIFLSQFGFATSSVLDWAGEYPHYDSVNRLLDAYIGSTGHLYVCVDGSYDNQQQQYWIMVPTEVIATTPERLDLVDDYEYYWRESHKELWHLPRANIRVAPCDQRPNETLRTIKIVSIDAGMSGSFKTKDILDESFSSRADSELVYELNVTNGAGTPIERRDLAYANRESNFGEGHTMLFETIYHIESGSKWWYATLPFAWLLDVIAWPFELILWLQYAYAHH